jgi:hypothetical protein
LWRCAENAVVAYPGEALAYTALATSQPPANHFIDGPSLSTTNRAFEDASDTAPLLIPTPNPGENSTLGLTGRSIRDCRGEGLAQLSAICVGFRILGLWFRFWVRVLVDKVLVRAKGNCIWAQAGILSKKPLESRTLVTETNRMRLVACKPDL